MDFTNYKFHCSSLGNLLVDSRTKEALSETTKTYLKELWIAEMYSRKKVISTKYTSKGIAVESDSLDLVKAATGKIYFKNQKTYENEFIVGTPDVENKNDDFILDIKSSWDIWTFGAVSAASAKKCYYGQLLGYMMLTGKSKAKLAYCLVNTPEDQVQYEIYKLKVSGAIKEDEEDKARINFIFDDIPAKERIKLYDFELEAEIKDKVIERIKLAREYMQTISL